MTADELALLAEQEGIGVCNEQAPLHTIDYARPLKDYATPCELSSFITARERSFHIYTDSLRKNGLVIKEAMEKYLASKDYVSSGALKEALKSPLHLFYALESGWKDKLEAYEKKKNHFDLGNFIHQAILEPRKFKRVVVEPGFKLNTRDGVKSLISFWEDKLSEAGEESKVPDKERIKDCVVKNGFGLDKIDGLKQYYSSLKAASGFEAIDEANYLIVSIMYSNYKRYADGILFELLKHSKRETSLYYQDPVYCIPQRIRPDAMQFKENIGADTIISVKSTRAESIGHFFYHTAKYCYELTEGMYLDVASAVTGRDFRCTIMIMVQTVPPFGIAVFVWNPEDLEIGKYKYRQALQTVLECRESGRYPGYDAYAESGHRGLIAMKQPEWNAKELHPVDVED